MLREQDASRPDTVPTAAFRLREFEATDSLDANRHASDGVHTDVTIVLGSARMSPREASTLHCGALVMLEQDVADPVEIYSRGSLVGRGQVVVIDDKFCVRIVELSAAEQAA